MFFILTYESYLEGTLETSAHNNSNNSDESSNSSNLNSNNKQQ